MQISFFKSYYLDQWFLAYVCNINLEKYVKPFYIDSMHDNQKINKSGHTDIYYRLDFT